MWIITDSENTIVDKASKELQLSRGYLLAGVKTNDDAALIDAGYKKIEITEKIDARINDSFDKDTLVKNEKYRAQVELPPVEEDITLNTLLSEKAEELGYADIKAEYDTKISALKTRRTELLGIINAN